MVFPDQGMVSVLDLVFGSGIMEELSYLGPFFPMVLDVVKDEQVLTLGHLLLLNIFV